MSIRIDKPTINTLAQFADIIYAIFEKKPYEVPTGYSSIKEFQADVFGTEEIMAGVFQKSGTKEYVITFRGTDSIWDTLDDSLFWQSDFKDYHGNSVNGVQLHHGFFAAYDDKKWFSNVKSLRSTIWDWMSDEIGFDNMTKFYITGHSLGSALATLFTYDLFVSGGIKCPVYHYNFASPMVGNQAFCTDFQRYMSGVSSRPSLYAIRIVNTRDVVPKYPGLLDSDYVHFDNSFEVKFCLTGYKGYPKIASKGNILNLLKDLFEAIFNKKAWHDLTEESQRVLICHSMDNYKYVCKHLDANNHFEGTFKWAQNSNVIVESW